MLPMDHGVNTLKKVPWRSDRCVVRFSCIVLGIFLSAAITALAAEESVPSAKKAVLGEIVCQGSVSYKTGIGPQLTQANGTFPIALPLQVRTPETHCKVILGSQAILEAAAGSEFSVQQDKTGGLMLIVKTGAVVYALAENSPLSISVPGIRHGAEAGQVPQTLVTQTSNVYSFAAHVGVVKVAAGPAVEFVNLKGLLSVARDDGPVQALAAGKSVQVAANSAPDVVLSPLIAAAAPSAKPAASAVSKSKPIASWWAVEPRADAAFGIGTLFVYPSDPSKQAYLPEVRTRISPWMPQVRRRTSVDVEPDRPWEPPIHRR